MNLKHIDYDIEMSTIISIRPSNLGAIVHSLLGPGPDLKMREVFNLFP